MNVYEREKNLTKVKEYLLNPLARMYGRPEKMKGANAEFIMDEWNENFGIYTPKGLTYLFKAYVKADEYGRFPSIGKLNKIAREINPETQRTASKNQSKGEVDTNAPHGWYEANIRRYRTDKSAAWNMSKKSALNNYLDWWKADYEREKGRKLKDFSETFTLCFCNEDLPSSLEPFIQKAMDDKKDIAPTLKPNRLFGRVKK